LGEEAFRKIEKARIVLVGAGGIGSNLALAALAGTGFKNLTLIDGDTVSRRNIPLSVPFTKQDIGRAKVEVVREMLKRKYGNRLNIRCYASYTDRIPLKVLTEPEMLILGVDDRWTRLAVNNIRVQADKLYVNLGFFGWEASYMLVIPHKTACYACLFRPTEREKVEKLKREGRCPEPEPNIPGGTLPGTILRLVGIAGNEIVKFFTNKENLVQYYSFDVSTGREETRLLSEPNYFKPDSQCPVCMKDELTDISSLNLAERRRK